MKEIDIFSYQGDGYQPMLDFHDWRVAFLRYAERFDPTYIRKMERHLETDEVFVLLQGKALLVIGDQKEVYPLEPQKLYNVKQGIWHAVCVSKDALLLIVENRNTSMENTEYKSIDRLEVKL